MKPEAVIRNARLGRMSNEGSVRCYGCDKLTRARPDHLCVRCRGGSYRDRGRSFVLVPRGGRACRVKPKGAGPDV